MSTPQGAVAAATYALLALRQPSPLFVLSAGARDLRFPAARAVEAPQRFAPRPMADTGLDTHVARFRAPTVDAESSRERSLGDPELTRLRAPELRASA